MDEFKNNYANWKKPDLEEWVLYDSVCIQFLQMQTYLWWQKADVHLRIVEQKGVGDNRYHYYLDCDDVFMGAYMGVCFMISFLYINYILKL